MNNEDVMLEASKVYEKYKRSYYTADSEEVNEDFRKDIVDLLNECFGFRLSLENIDDVESDEVGLLLIGCWISEMNLEINGWIDEYVESSNDIGDMISCVNDVYMEMITFRKKCEKIGVSAMFYSMVVEYSVLNGLLIMLVRYNIVEEEEI